MASARSGPPARSFRSLQSLETGVAIPGWAPSRSRALAPGNDRQPSPPAGPARRAGSCGRGPSATQTQAPSSAMTSPRHRDRGHASGGGGGDTPLRRTAHGPGDRVRVSQPMVNLMVVVLSATSAGAVSVGPVYPGDFPDPSVMVVGGRYWAYSTGSGGRNLQVMSSTDMSTWTAPVDPLPCCPPGLAPP